MAQSGRNCNVYDTSHELRKRKLAGESSGDRTCSNNWTRKLKCLVTNRRILFRLDVSKLFANYLKQYYAVFQLNHLWSLSKLQRERKKSEGIVTKWFIRDNIPKNTPTLGHIPVNGLQITFCNQFSYFPRFKIFPATPVGIMYYRWYIDSPRTCKSL